MSSEKIIIRKINSFVRREGNMTKYQKKAFDELMPIYGLDPHTPFNEVAVFGSTATLVLEIGFGMGDSLIALAQAHPEKHFIGIEVHRPGVGKLCMELKKNNITNVRVYCDDAIEVLDRVMPYVCMDVILLFFPDPWPKKRHHKRRIMKESFLQMVYHLLRSEGIFHIATDWQDYADYIKDLMNYYPQFQPTTSPYRPSTKYARRGQRLGHAVWDFAFKK